ncbi:MAG: alginate O-acetyltransferase complex protein AlgI [Sphingomonadales bacterium]|jgi:D-alanyl-lipoteichoic acid acyltransferase DltB (MBOAT superfamily)|nr:alginate O-acetyltransferase complex protein AlgI [Sphingomonadales bacterium]
MSFASWSFILLFLPLVLIAFHALHGGAAARWRAILLIGASILFYGLSGAHNLLVAGCSILANVVAGKLLTQAGRLSGGARRALMWAAVAFNVALLSAFKIEAVGAAGPDGFRAAESILIPLGLSYLTFQQIGFVVAAYRRQIAGFSLRDYLFFITFFPKIVMGPIVPFPRVAAQLAQASLRKAGSADIAIGFSIFVMGLAQKLLLADQIAPAVDSVFLGAQHSPISPAESWFAIIAFQLQLYFDFVAYTDMAIGLARMFGMRLPINFDRPLMAIDRFDLWRRWHISFAVFMRTHVFVPLARRWRWPLAGALAATGILSGLWHGLGWTFVLWGLVQTAILLVAHERRKRARRRGPVSSFGRIRAIALTFLVSALVGGLFRSPTLESAANIYGALAGLALMPEGATLLGPRAWIMLPLCAIAAWGLPNSAQFFVRHWNAIDLRPDAPAPPPHPLRALQFALTRNWAMGMAAAFILCLMLIGDARRFVYVQF